MAEFPAFPLWTDAYLADTTDLTTLEHGAYLLLLIAMWRAGGYLPDDDAKLARFTHLGPKQWVSMRVRLIDFLTVEDGRITQGRLLDELSKARLRSKKASDSARAKYRKPNDLVPANAKAKQSPTPASTTTSTTISNKEDSSLRSLGPIVENDDVKLAFDDWNKLADFKGLPRAKTITATRKASIRQRLSECGGIDGWRDALRLIPQSPFLMGENSNGFTATLDFVLQASSFTKLREGNYNKRGNGPAAAPLKGAALVRANLQRKIDDERRERQEGPDLAIAGGLSLLGGPNQ